MKQKYQRKPCLVDNASLSLSLSNFSFCVYTAGRGFAYIYLLAQRTGIEQTTTTEKVVFYFPFPFTWDLLARRRVRDTGCRLFRRSWCPVLSRPCTGGSRSPRNRTSPVLFSYLTKLQCFKCHWCRLQLKSDF
jgi:hypothetical protein